MTDEEARMAIELWEPPQGQSGALVPCLRHGTTAWCWQNGDGGHIDAEECCCQSEPSPECRVDAHRRQPSAAVRRAGESSNRARTRTLLVLALLRESQKSHTFRIADPETGAEVLREAYRRFDEAVSLPHTGQDLGQAALGLAIKAVRFIIDLGLDVPLPPGIRVARLLEEKGGEPPCQKPTRS